MTYFYLKNRVHEVLLFMAMLVFSKLFGESLPHALLNIHPLPESRFHSTQTNIILRLREEYLERLKNLTYLIHVTGEYQQYDGTLFFATDGKTIIFDPTQSFLNHEAITVTVAINQPGGDDDFEFTFYTASAQPELPKTSQAEIDTSAEPLYAPDLSMEVRMINDIAVPADFPEITIRQYGESEPGMIFYATAYPTTAGNYLIICKNDGTPYFYRKCMRGKLGSNNFTLHPNGLLSAFVYTETNRTRNYLIFDSTLTQIDIYKPGHGYDLDGHELLFLDNGHALIIGKQSVRFDLSASVQGAKSNVKVTGTILQELDRGKNVIFEWRSWDYFDITDAVHEDLKDSYIDYVHMNSAAIDFDGHYIISSRHLSEVTKINRTTGEIIWRLGGLNNQFGFTNETVPLSYQHDARPVKDKPNHYLVFDNGTKRLPDYSRAVEYQLDTLNMIAENVWEYRYVPDRQVNSMGSVQRLPGGNILIDWPDDSTQVCEVTPEGDIVFELNSKGHINYRCRRYEFHGKMQVPYLQIENHGYFVRLFFNKFGDENVETYNVYTGDTDKPEFLLTSTSQTYYDVTQLLNKTTNFFRVTAVDGAGNESGFSQTESTYVQTIESGENVIQNGSFNSHHFYWNFNVDSSASAYGSITNNNKYYIQIEHSGNENEDIQLVQERILLLQGKSYLFEFDAYATVPGVIDAVLEKIDYPNMNYNKSGSTYVTRKENRFQYSFVMEEPTDTEARLTFNCGQMNGDLYIDNISLVYADDSPAGSIIRINFQPDYVTPPNDYMMDVGAAYSTKSNGYSYGWLKGANERAQFRDTYEDVRYATFNYLKKTDPHIWEIEVPNGKYSVHLVMGDPSQTDQINHFKIEETEVQDPDGGDHFDEFALAPIVRDNKLTLSPAALSENAKICFIEIRFMEIINPNDSLPLPKLFNLAQNYPNPFNKNTIIQYTIAKAVPVQLSVYNCAGQLIEILEQSIQQPGFHSVTFDGIRYASGVYFYQLKSGSETAIRKMLLMK
ncbi:arylsulfotransferase family protein [bacterium]